MYLMTKAGFFEIDRWDGTPIKDGPPFVKGETIFIVRAREKAHIHRFVENYLLYPVQVYHTPEHDYAWRVFLPPGAMEAAMGSILAECDYRNFKSWCLGNRPEMAALAHDIWEASYDDVEERRKIAAMKRLK